VLRIRTALTPTHPPLLPPPPRAERTSYGPGEAVIREGDNPKSFFIIVAGLCKLAVRDKDVRPSLVPLNPGGTPPVRRTACVDIG
jgi:hypothetical protein